MSTSEKTEYEHLKNIANGDRPCCEKPVFASEMYTPILIQNLSGCVCNCSEEAICTVDELLKEE